MLDESRTFDRQQGFGYSSILVRGRLFVLYADIEIEISGDMLAVDRRDIDDRKGVVAWDWRTQPNATKTLSYTVEARYPSDKRIRGL